MCLWFGSAAIALVPWACASSPDTPEYTVPSPDASEGSAGQGQGGTGGSVGLDVNLDTSGSETPGLDACAGVLEKAEVIPLDLYFMLDTSGSMGNSSFMDPLRNGVVGFLQDPKSTGLGVTGQKFPFPKNGEPLIDSCEPADYGHPTITWGIAPAPNFATWVSKLASQGETPSVAALTGAINACRQRIKDFADHKCYVVFVTDGQPYGECKPDQLDALQPLKDLAAGALAEGIKVFAIGFPGLEPFGIEVLKGIAEKGGTSAPVLIQYNDAGTGGVDQQFIQSLNDIRFKALGCEFKMPVADGGVVNPAMVNVQFRKDESSDFETLYKKKSEQDCGEESGWYYDNDSAPTKLLLCPSVCKALQGSVAASAIQIQLGCSQLVK